MSDVQPPRRLFLSEPPDGGPARLAPEDRHHARNVLRLAAGERVLGLDGHGGAWPLVVRAVGRRDVQLEPDGEPHREPAPGEPGAPLPHVRLAVSLPRGGRAEDMLERLTQLGAAAVVPLVVERTPPHGRALSAHRRERLVRAAREACKQAARLWVPALEASASLEEVLAPGDPTALLDPTAERPLAEWIGERLAAGLARLTLVVGPEGGFTAAEVAAAERAGAARCRLVPHVLRVATAAELACGLVAHLASAAQVPKSRRSRSDT